MAAWAAPAGGAGDGLGGGLQAGRKRGQGFGRAQVEDPQAEGPHGRGLLLGVVTEVEGVAARDVGLGESGLEDARGRLAGAALSGDRHAIEKISNTELL